MDKKAIFFFAVLLFLAAILILIYRSETDPFKNFRRSQPQAEMHQHNAGLESAILIYKKNCMNCHGSFGEGMSGPRLSGTQLTIEQIKSMIRTGRGKMPAFPDIREPELTKVAELVKFF